jgi:hypothetical protein
MRRSRIGAHAINGAASQRGAFTAQICALNGHDVAMRKSARERAQTCQTMPTPRSAVCRYNRVLQPSFAFSGPITAMSGLPSAFSTKSSGDNPCRCASKCDDA